MHPVRISLLSTLALLACQAGAQIPGADTPRAGAQVVFGQPLSESTLGDLRGGADTTVNDMQLNGTTASNSAVNVNTGSNTIGTGAFAAMNGIPIVVQNTGANVLIQNALILNLRMQ